MAHALEVPASQAPREALAETMTRLSKKAGVVATLVLDRGSGIILQRTGSIGSLSLALGAQQTRNFDSTAGPAITEAGSSSPSQAGVEEFAAMVWKFMNAAGGLVQDLDLEDEVKLLRLRTKKHELVIVPDVKYILIVVHETSPA